ncbi:MAG TPA: Uma2 family endonuclease [Chloroflexota bacterium]|nr:Uma2 family endonuclease [Chloroflexota bacterium]
MAVANLTETNLGETADLTTPLVQWAVDDTNGAPWMTMPEFQYFVARLLVGILRLHAQRRGLPWHVTGELTVSTPKPEGGTLTLGPDILLVEEDGRLRSSWDVRSEGRPPRLALEIITQDSVYRDTVLKPAYYDYLGVDEYILYWPERKDGGPLLFGYRRDREGSWGDWQVEGDGVLRSAVLDGLGLVVGELPWLRVVDAQGNLLPSPEEEAARAEREAERADAAEAELARLRARFEGRNE